MRVTALISILILACAAHTLAQTTLHVDATAPAGGDGASWATAYRYLQDALVEIGTVCNGDCEIRVADGLYRPDQSENGNAVPGDRHATFQLVSGLRLIGGYAGLGADNPDAYDPTLYETVLSGDLATDDLPDSWTNHTENSYHVLRAEFLPTTTVVQGFSIAGGYADYMDSLTDRVGGGVYCYRANLVLCDSVLTRNRAQSGCAIHSSKGGATFLRCVFEQNEVLGGRGGAIAAIVEYADVLIVERCTFRYNVSSGGGGAMDVIGLADDEHKYVVISDTVFEENSAAVGGALDISSEYPGRFHIIIQDSCFKYNTAAIFGGAISCQGLTSITNTSFLGNTCYQYAGTITNGIGNLEIRNSSIIGNWSVAHGAAIETLLSSTVTIENSILCNPDSWSGIEIDLRDGRFTTLNIDYSCLCGGPSQIALGDNSVVNWGAGNLVDPPTFVDGLGPDGLPGTGDEDVRLAPGSLGIDAGSNLLVPADEFDLDGDGDTTERVPFDLDGLLRFVDDPDTVDTGVPDPPVYPFVVDMGAYEYQPPDPCPHDLDGDGFVDPFDSNFVMARFGCPVGQGDPECDRADLDDDGHVNPFDSNAVMAFFGPCP